MSDNSAATTTEAVTGPVGGARGGADAVAGALAMLMTVLAFIQFGLAGWGAYGGSFVLHGYLGTATGGVSLLVMIAALVARVSRRVITMSVLLFVLAWPVQTVLAAIGFNVNAWFGALHALNGILIFSLSGYLMAESRQRRGARR